MSVQQVDGEPAFVLHTKAYRESSQLVDLFSRHHGRLRLVARGSLRRSKGRGRTIEPFAPLIVGWRGKGELKTLANAEPSGTPLILCGDCLFSGFYLNELILRLLADHDPHETLFDCYLSTLHALSEGQHIELALRRFERQLLSDLGYGLALEHSEDSGAEIDPEGWYWFDPVVGVTSPTLSPLEREQPNCFSGDSLLAIAAEDYSNPSHIKAAKRLMRLAIQNLLGDRPLRSRELFARGQVLNRDSS